MHHLELGDTQCRGVAGDSGAAPGVALDGDGGSLATAAGAIAGNRAQPFDRHRSRPGADIPQHLARQRRQRGHRHRPHLSLGQLAVALVRVVRQAGHPRQNLGVGPGATFDGEGVEVGAAGMVPGFGDAVDAPFLRTAQVLEHGDGARPEPALGQQRRRLRRRIAVPAQHQHSHIGGDGEVEVGERPPMHGQGFHIGQRPHHPRGGKAEGPGIRQHGDLGRIEPPGQVGAGAVVHRIAGRQHDHPTAAPLGDLVQRRLEASGPGQALGGGLGDHRLMTVAADQEFGGVDQGAGGRAQAAEAVVANADDGEPGGHPWSPPRALTAAAAKALPPRRPRRVT